MCKINTDLEITKIDFTSRKGKFIVYLNDGREIAFPDTYFPRLAKYPLEKRKKNCVILDCQSIVFDDPSYTEGYTLEELLDVKYKSKTKKYVDFYPPEKPAKKKVTATKKATPKKVTASKK